MLSEGAVFDQLSTRVQNAGRPQARSDVLCRGPENVEFSPSQNPIEKPRSSARSTTATCIWWIDSG